MLLLLNIAYAFRIWLTLMNIFVDWWSRTFLCEYACWSTAMFNVCTHEYMYTSKYNMMVYIKIVWTSSKYNLVPYILERWRWLLSVLIISFVVRPRLFEFQEYAHRQYVSNSVLILLCVIGIMAHYNILNLSIAYAKWKLCFVVMYSVKDELLNAFCVISGFCVSVGCL